MLMVDVFLVNVGRFYTYGFTVDLEVGNTFLGERFEDLTPIYRRTKTTFF